MGLEGYCVVPQPLTGRFCQSQRAMQEGFPKNKYLQRVGRVDVKNMKRQKRRTHVTPCSFRRHRALPNNGQCRNVESPRSAIEVPESVPPGPYDIAGASRIIRS
jgi:hypothetical protein